MSTVIISYRVIFDILLQCSVKVTVSAITALNKIQKFTKTIWLDFYRYKYPTNLYNQIYKSADLDVKT